MLYQVTAYEALGAITVQATTATTSPSGYGWEHRILETLELPEGVAGDAWDVLWAIGQLLCERALERGSRQ